MFCRERDPERKNLFWPKRGATKRIAVSFEFAFEDVSVGKEWHAGGVMVLRTCTGVGVTLWEVPVQCRRLWWRWAHWKVPFFCFAPQPEQPDNELLARHRWRRSFFATAQIAFPGTQA